MNPQDSLQALFFISWFVFIGFGDHNFLLHFTSSISTTIYFHSILNHIDITWKWILLAQNKELKNRCMNNRKGKMIISCDMNQAGWKECSAPSWKQVSTEGLMTFKFYTMNTIPFIFFSTLYMHAQLLQSCLTFFWPRGLWPARLLCLWDSPGKNTGLGCHSFLQRIFLTQGSHICHICQCLLHCRQILDCWASREAT